MGKRRGNKQAVGKLTAGSLMAQGIDVQNLGLAAAQRQAAALKRLDARSAGVSKRGGKRAGKGPRGQKGQGKGPLSQAEKAIRKACTDDNVNALLSSALLAGALAGAEETAGMVVETLVKHAKMREATSLLDSPDVRISTASVLASLLSLPQLHRIEPQVSLPSPPPTLATTLTTTTQSVAHVSHPSLAPLRPPPSSPQAAVDFVKGAVAGRSTFFEAQATSHLSCPNPVGTEMMFPAFKGPFYVMLCYRRRHPSHSNL